jgi:hypothetical protein|tara:strand:- start:1456 stop:2076 length:621 start_codon:yes stop_codon:yes gene_type:complete
MANTTFSGPVRSKGGFNVINENSTTGAITQTGFSVNSTGQLISLGSRKIQTFVGSLAATDTASAYTDGDVLVELGTLNSDHPDALVTATKFFIHKAVVGITTAAGQTLLGTLKLSATSGTATNAAVSSGTEIVGAGVTAFSPTISADASVTEIDINFNNTAGNFHVFEPNTTAPIASNVLYAAATTALNADASAGRFTVELEYSVF